MLFLLPGTPPLHFHSLKFHPSLKVEVKSVPSMQSSGIIKLLSRLFALLVGSSSHLFRVLCKLSHFATWFKALDDPSSLFQHLRCLAVSCLQEVFVETVNEFLISLTLRTIWNSNSIKVTVGERTLMDFFLSMSVYLPWIGHHWTFYCSLCIS